MEVRKYNDGSGRDWSYFFLKRHELDGILAQSGDTYEPRGMFVCRDRLDDGVTVYTAMRNLDGGGATEEFRNVSAAVRWLYGLPFYPSSLYRDAARTDKELEDLLEAAGIPEEERKGRI